MKKRKLGDAPPAGRAGAAEQPIGGGKKGMKKRRQDAGVARGAGAAAPANAAVAGSNWQALKRKIGADGSGPKKAEKRVNKAAALSVELVAVATGGARRPESKGSGHEPTSVVAIDCEMVGVGPSGKASSLARATVINNLGNVLLDVHVQQREKVTDFRTHVSGIRPSDIRAEKGALPLEEVQKQVHALVKGRLLVGHAIHNDLQALQLSHPHKLIRDTAKYPPLMRVVHNGKRKPKPRALRKLAAEQLGFEIQAGEHSPVDDARCALYLYHKHRKEWEKWLRSNRAHNLKKSRDNNPTSKPSPRSGVSKG
mmetsp:Transcript_35362/g.89142  ORF Transcript_35362/g.89142 Transcript_35362/m.89142 type:complete len:311 (+) Transcript_35362:507-1439(+)